MGRPGKLARAGVAAGALAAALSGCTSQHTGAGVAAQYRHGAQLFKQRCGGCHTFSFAATHGSASNIQTRERNDGPNFNVRREKTMTRVLFAIRNGGFSGGIMPQNIVVGPDAEAVARFVVRYSGRKSSNTFQPTAPPSGSTPGSTPKPAPTPTPGSGATTPSPASTQPSPPAGGPGG